MWPLEVVDRRRRTMAIPDEHRGIVGAAARAAGVIGVPGAFSFGLDVGAMGVIWAGMIGAIAAKSNHEINKEFAVKVATGVATGVGAYVVGSKIAMGLLNFIPFAGTLTAIGINSVLNYLFTYKLGNVITKLFAEGESDVADMEHLIVTVASMVGAFPSAREVSDMLKLASEPLDHKTFGEFMAAVKG
jgi:uncharacterized protein (DUF697 family)